MGSQKPRASSLHPAASPDLIQSLQNLKGKTAQPWEEAKFENSRGPCYTQVCLVKGKGWQIVLLPVSLVSPDPTLLLYPNSKALMAPLSLPGRMLL